MLVGSVAGQRYWSSMLNLDSIITCGIWTPDDQQVYFGTAHGQIIVMDVHGAMVSQVQLYTDMKITSMAWSCEKFKMEEGEDDPGVTNAGWYICKTKINNFFFRLTICFCFSFRRQTEFRAGSQFSEWIHLFAQIIRRRVTSTHKYGNEWVHWFCNGME